MMFAGSGSSLGHEPHNLVCFTGDEAGISHVNPEQQKPDKPKD